jgi:hypothetical protein
MLNQLELRERRSEDCLSDFALDRLKTGDLEPLAERERISLHLGGCERCRARLATLAAVVAPSFDFSGVKPAPPGRSWRRHAWWLAPVAAAAMALLIPWRSPGVRGKGGGWQLGVVARDPNGRVGGVSPGATLSPGDHLRFEVSAPADAFVSVISLDAAGAVTPFVPATGTTVAVRAGQRRLLDGAVRLDDSLGPERLLLLACPRPVPIDALVAAGRTALAQARGRIAEVKELDPACTQTSFWIRKENRR